MIVREIWTTRPAPSSAPMAPVFLCHGMKCRITCISGKKMPTADSLTDDAGANVSLNKRNTSGADYVFRGEQTDCLPGKTMRKAAAPPMPLLI